jgi:hypothetical protein
LRSLTQEGAQPGGHVVSVDVGVKQAGRVDPRGPASSQQSCPDVQQDAPQQVSPVAHEPPSILQGIDWHDPLQYVPAPHLMSQPPQLSGSFKMFVQWPLQQKRPTAQAGEHALPPSVEPLLLPLLDPDEPEPPLELLELAPLPLEPLEPLEPEVLPPELP